MQHRYNDIDMARSTTRELITELRALRHELAGERDRFVRPAIETRIAAVEHTLAIHNARATAQLDGMSEARLVAIEWAVARETAGEYTLNRDHVLELVAEVRRLQGQCAMMPPEAAELRPKLAQLASDLGDVDDQIHKIPGIGVAIKTLRYVRQCLYETLRIPPAAEDFGAEPVVQQPATASYTTHTRVPVHYHPCIAADRSDGYCNECRPGSGSGATALTDVHAPLHDDAPLEIEVSSAAEVAARDGIEGSP